MELERRAEEERRRWTQLSAKDKLAEWAARHQLGIIVSSWVASMGVAGAIVMRDK